MISFFVHGQPISQGSTKAFTPKGHTRPIITSTAKGLGAWRRLVADVAQPHAHLFEGAVAVDLIFLMPRPKSLPKTKPRPMTKRPDADKLARSILDSLTHVFYHDDAQVTLLKVRKVYANPGGPVGVYVRIWEPRVEDEEIAHVLVEGRDGTRAGASA